MCLSCSVLSCSVLFNSVMFVEGAGGGITGDTRDNLGSGGRGMQGGGVAGGSVLRNLTTPTCRVGKKADVFCHALLWYVLFCHVLSCSALSCHAVFSFSSRAGGAGYPGSFGDSRDNLGSGGRGMQGGGVAGGSVLRNLTTPTCRVGKKADVFCHALLWYVLFCHVVSCSVLSCHVVFSFSSRARGRDTQGHSGTIGGIWGLAAALSPPPTDPEEDIAREMGLLD